VIPVKKLSLLLLAVFVFSLSSTVSAASRHHASPPPGHQKKDNRYWNDRYDNDWHKNDHSEHSMPFNWHERHDRFSPHEYRMERIHDRGWQDRFPGLQPYRWHDNSGKGFWYRGHHITDAVMFYNDSDHLISVGFWHDGAFIIIRDDNDSYETRDSFFFAWQHR
jgi:hypothetical protein